MSSIVTAFPPHYEALRGYIGQFRGRWDRICNENLLYKMFKVVGGSVASTFKFKKDREILISPTPSSSDFRLAQEHNHWSIVDNLSWRNTRDKTCNIY
jgi:hypothetical protein